jgi:hypothetical protein
VKSHILRRTKAGGRRLKLPTQPHFAVNPKAMHALSMMIADATPVPADEVIE